MKSRFILATLVAAVSLVGTAEAASYGTISGYFERRFAPDAPSGGATATLSASSPLANPGGDSASTSQGGQFTFNTTGGTADSALPNVLLTFCLEIPQPIAFGSPTSSVYTYKVGDLADAPVATPVPIGHANLMDPKAVTLIDRLFDAFYRPDLNSGEQAAFQLALWKLEYDYPAPTTPDLPLIGSGNKAAVINAFNKLSSAAPPGTAYLTVNASAGTALMNEAIKEINVVKNLSGPPIADKYTLFSLTNELKQDQVIAFLNSGSVPFLVVPEPGSIVLWGAFGLIGLAFARRRQAG